MNAPPVTPQLQFEVEQFLYAEAALLDEQRYQEWRDLLAPDLRYRMPLWINEKAAAADAARRPDLTHFDDDLASLDVRIRRLLTAARTGLVPAENPPPRVRRMVTNVRITGTPSADEVEVACCFILHRARLDLHSDTFHGARVDRLRRSAQALGWQLVSRLVHLDQATVAASSLNVLF